MNLERLNEPLDPKRVKERVGSGGRSLSYIESHDAIRTANEIFGFGGWGHEVQELRLIGAAPVTNREGKPGIHVGYLCIVKLSVGSDADGVPSYFNVTSGVGYGDATEYREGFMMVTAHELAAKEAESDALKRALKNYGDQWGLALYSKTAATDGHVAASSAGGSAQATTERPTNSDGLFRWPSGKHSGSTLAETPRGYIEWAKENWQDGGVRAACEAFLAEPDTDQPFPEGFDDSIPFRSTIDGFS